MSVDFKCKYELKKLFIVSLRQMFANDADYPYNDNDTLTSILITNKMPLNTEQNQLPVIVWNGASYSVQAESLGNNFLEEVPGKSNLGVPIKNAGKRYTTTLSFSTSLSVISTVEDEAATIADHVFDYLYLEYPDQLQGLGLYIDSVSVGDTSVKETTPQIQYLCPIGVQGHLRLVWTSTRILDSALIDKIKLQLTTYK